jgi:queuine tRNA-ribosyltransferase
MVKFEIIKRSKRSRARLGILKTSHGLVETPAIVPVATQATIKTLTTDQVLASGTQLLIANTFHLHLKPGERFVKKAGGLHTFMHWPKPLMTDSAGFQVFSLGFGRDLGLGKIAKWDGGQRVEHGRQPQHLKITDRGVHFRSPVDGRPLFIGPKESIKIQAALGADIILTFDECPPPSASKKYVQASLDRTHAWALECLKAHRSKQALSGIVQGGSFKDLRQQSAEFIGELPFPGFAIGGEFGTDKHQMAKMVGWVNDVLPDAKPRHLLGIGHPEDIPHIIKAGVDTFDCIVPTHYARHGTAFISSGRLDVNKTVLLGDKKPLDPKCGCDVCHNYSRSYIAHLFKAKEITGMVLVTMHNLWYFNQLVAQYRRLIKQGKL